MIKQKESTSCYTYEVVLTVQVLAENLEQADMKIELDGGHVSRREVTLKDTVKIYDGSQDSVEALADSSKEGKTED